MHDYRFVATTAILNDIIPIVDILSKTMQRSGASFTVLVSLVPPVRAALENLKEHKGPCYAELPLRLSETGDLANIKLKYGNAVNPVRQSFHQSVYIGLLSRLVEQLDARFPDYDLLVALTVLFDPQKLCSEDAARHDYGEQQLDFLLDHYCKPVFKNEIENRVRLEWSSVEENPNLGRESAQDDEAWSDKDGEIPPYLDQEQIRHEWKVVRTMLRAHCNKERQTVLKLEDVLALLIQTYGVAFPNTALLASAASVIVCVTVPNERSFSVMKQHKTAVRNSMSDITLDQLMRITIEGPDIDTPEFEKLLEEVVQYWLGKKNRRCARGWSANVLDTQPKEFPCDSFEY
jgi:hypothetical protein